MNKNEDSNVEELVLNIKEIWNQNKKSQELIDKCENLFKKQEMMDIEIYLIYLNSLVNMKKHDKALDFLENNKYLKNNQEIIAFKLKLLFFLRRYEECQSYIKSVSLNEENEMLASKTLDQIKKQTTKVEKTSNTNTKEKSVNESNKIKEEVKVEKEQIKEKSKEKFKESKEKPVKNNKSKSKYIIGIILIIILCAVGIYLFKKNSTNINIKTTLSTNSISNQDQYKSKTENIAYELPRDKEFEFVSSIISEKDKDKELYVTYKVSDKNVASITEDGFFKGEKLGNVDILTLNKGKVIDTITVKVVQAKAEEVDIVDSQEDYSLSNPEDSIREMIKSYENSYVKAVNEGNPKLVEKYLVKGGPLDTEHSVNIEKFHSDGIREKLQSLEFGSIDEIDTNEYLVNVYETIAITKNGEENIREFDAFYNVRMQDNGTYAIYEMALKN